MAKFAKFNLKLFCVHLTVIDKNFKLTKDGIGIEKWRHYKFIYMASCILHEISSQKYNNRRKKTS